MSSIPVREADALSSTWRVRFMRDSAALGEEAITSDLVLTLEERFAPYVRTISSFSRAQEGGGSGLAGNGADLEVYFTTASGADHLGFRIQAKLAKQTRTRDAPLWDYDLNYTTRSGASQIDALINSAGSCHPLYFLYSSPDAEAEMHPGFLAARPVRDFLHDWPCEVDHAVQFDTALTIAALPARVARARARASATRLVTTTAVAPFVTPWSCLFHQDPWFAAPSTGPLDSRSDQLTLPDLKERWVDHLHALSELAQQYDTPDLGRYLRRDASRSAEASPLPRDVARLWQGNSEITLESLARNRVRDDSRTFDGDDDDLGDSQLRDLVIVEVAE